MSTITSANFNLIVADLVDVNPSLRRVFFQEGEAHEPVARYRPDNIELAHIDPFKDFYARTAGALLTAVKGIEDRILPAWLDQQLRGITNGVNAFTNNSVGKFKITDGFGRTPVNFLPPDASEQVFESLLHTFGALQGPETDADLLTGPGIDRNGISVSLAHLAAGLLGTYRFPDMSSPDRVRQPRSLEFEVTLNDIFNRKR